MSQPEKPPEAPSKVPSPAKSGKSVRSFLPLLAVAVVLAVGGLIWWWHSAQYEQTDNATLTGHVSPISARVGGNIRQVLVMDNQPVRQGQLLALIDPRDYEIALSEAEHNLENVKAQAKTAYENIRYTEKQGASQLTQAQGAFGASQAGIAQARQSVSEARAAVSQSRQSLREQEANYQKAAADYQRYRGADPDAVSAQQLDAAATQFKASEAARNAARAMLQQMQARLAQAQSGVETNVSKLTQSKGVVQSAQSLTNQLEVVKSQYAAAQTAIHTAEDQVRQAKLNLAYTRIYAPISGRVGRKTLEIGQRVQAGEPLMSVVSPQVWIIANYKETQLERMRPRQPVDIHVDAFPGHRFTGQVQSFSPASGSQFALLPPENATGNFTKIVQRVPVKILLDAQSLKGFEDLLVPGMSTVVSVHVTAPPEQAPAETAQAEGR